MKIVRYERGLLWTSLFWKGTAVLPIAVATVGVTVGVPRLYFQPFHSKKLGDALIHGCVCWTVRLCVGCERRFCSFAAGNPHLYTEFEKKACRELTDERRYLSAHPLEVAHKYTEHPKYIEQLNRLKARIAGWREHAGVARNSMYSQSVRSISTVLFFCANKSFFFSLPSFYKEWGQRRFSNRWNFSWIAAAATALGCYKQW